MLGENIADDVDVVTQCYFGRKTKADKLQQQSHNMKPKKEEGNENVNVRVIAIEKCLVDADEKETFKILTQIDY